MIDTYAAKFNAKLASADPSMIMDTKFGKLDATMTTYPTLSAETGLITINMDGRFVDETTGTIRAAGPTEAPALVDGKQREEIFIHQSFFNSMIFGKVKTFNSTAIQTEVLAAFPEIAAAYPDAAIQLVVSHANQKEGDFDQITFDVETGIQAGDVAQGGIVSDMKIMAGDEVAAEIQFGSVMTLNFTFDDFLIMKSYSNVQALNTVVQEGGKVALTADDTKMTALFTAIANDYNESHVDGKDLKKNAIVGFVAGMLRHSLLTPFQVDEYLYGGFSWITDGVW